MNDTQKNNSAPMRNGTYYKTETPGSEGFIRAKNALPYALWAFGLIFTLINSFVRPYLTLGWLSFAIIVVFSALLTAPVVIIEWKNGIRKALVVGLGIVHFLAFLLPFVMGAAFETVYMWVTAIAGVFVYEINYRALSEKKRGASKRKLCVFLFATTSVIVMVLIAFFMPLSGGVRFRANDNGGYTVIAASNFGKISVPGSVRGKPVTGVSAYAFSKNAFTKEVILPDTVTDTEYLSFAGMESVEALTLAPSSLPGGMMYGLWYSKSEDMASVANTLVPASLKKVTVIGSVTDGCFNLMTNLEEVEFKGNVKRIGSSAFAGCTSLKSIVVPETVTVIDTYAFSYCRALKDVTLPTNLKSIESLAFQYCTALRSFIIPENVSFVGAGAFDHCSALLKIEAKVTAETASASWDYRWTYQLQGYDDRGNPTFATQALSVTYAKNDPVEI